MYIIVKSQWSIAIRYGILNDPMTNENHACMIDCVNCTPLKMYDGHEQKRKKK